ncbi:MAG: peptidoglycan glycosyltransferase [Chloroflexus sp.]|uniref:peptidoglycan D,D-transpeptidase FtsI family protein n=1 Tax=Chloroflexus sp. TaxID=1904827 RepID=UPI0021DE72A2|nr:penicillin-binding protein 2 [Chloroflexus sp.]GIV88207.1 MAG: peptidoglycan glycosyltransferase [Chloroflexus sp.]
MRPRRFWHAPALVTALVLLMYGMFLPIEQEPTWLLLLWIGGTLAGLVMMSQTNATPSSNDLSRTVSRIGTVIILGFLMLSLQLLRQQLIKAEAISSYVVTGADGSTTSNVRPVLATQRVLRGSISDRKGRTLVESVLVNGIARRSYPLAGTYDMTAFGHILGFFSPRYGQSGLEARFNDYLSGERGNEWQSLLSEWTGELPQGNALTLTIDAELQDRVARLLGDRRGAVVVLDPRTGAILAMVSRPGFDPSRLVVDPAAADLAAERQRVSDYWSQLNQDDAGQPLLNRASQGRYPPGSTFKTVTAVAVLEHPFIGQPNQITCPNEYFPQPDAPPIVNAVNNLGATIGEPATLERVYAFSCNTAFAQYAVRLGADRFAEVAQRFNIFLPNRIPTGFRVLRDLPSEPSLLAVQTDFLAQPRALADTGYGQGQLLVTPLQMALIAATIANDGVMMEPYLVQRITRPDGSTVRQTTPKSVRRVMSSSTARQMREAMAAVARYGFGSSISQFVTQPVGGKSGTAEHVPGAPPHAWFIAIGPIDTPRYAVAVIIEQGGEGSGIAARLAGEVLAAAFALE